MFKEAPRARRDATYPDCDPGAEYSWAHLYYPKLHTTSPSCPCPNMSGMHLDAMQFAVADQVVTLMAHTNKK